MRGLPTLPKLATMPSIGRGAGGFSPLSLFASGEQGAWFDPSDLSSMYQDHLGGTPAVVGQPVGLILDRSQGQPGPQLGNMDLKPSDFTIIGGSVVITDLGDRLRLTRTAAAAGAIQAEYRSLPVQAGKTYEAEFKLLAVGGDSTVLSYTQIINGGVTFFLGAGYLSGPATRRAINVATGAGSGTLHLGLAVARGADPGASVEGDWIEVAKTLSVRELPGNHAAQATATARPTLDRVPKGGVTEQGQKTLHYLKSDGVDDIMVTPTIDMSHTDKITLWAVVTRQSASRMLAEFGANASGTDGAWYLSTENSYWTMMGGPSGYRIRKVSLGAREREPCVLVSKLDRANPDHPVMRINGVEEGEQYNSGDPFANNFRSFPLTLFARQSVAGSTLFPAAVELYAFGMIDRLLTPDETLKLEAYLGGLL